MAISYGQTLYYPSFEFNDSWIKTAALYYDHVNRIVPAKLVPKDSPTVQILIDEFQFVRNLDPPTSDIPESNFLEFANEHLLEKTTRTKLSNHLGEDLNGWLINIHSGKMSKSLFKELYKLGLGAYEEDDWYKFDALTGAMYMTFLAKLMAQGLQLPVTSDNPIYQNAMNALDVRSHDIAFNLAAIVVNSYVPKNIANVDVKKIIAFRKNHESERDAFYDAINALVKDVVAVDSSSVLLEILQHRKKRIDNAIIEIEKAGRGLGLEFIRGIYTITKNLLIGNPLEAGSAALDTAAAAINPATSNKSLGYILALRDTLDKETLAREMCSGKLIL
jgi:hypothetical protein